jgi:hypothetical protein
MLRPYFGLPSDRLQDNLQHISQHTWSRHCSVIQLQEILIYTRCVIMCFRTTLGITSHCLTKLYVLSLDMPDVSRGRNLICM